MTQILSREGASSIEDAASKRALLAFDFDGTLAPIVEDRHQARMREETRALLRMAATLYPCAVVSGRDRADVMARVGDVPLVAVIGNHGTELDDSRVDAGATRQVEAWAAALRNTFRGEAGIDVEEKALGVAVHYRRAPGRLDLHKRVLDAALALPGGRVFGGHAVVNVAPVELGTKGYAIEVLAQRVAARSVVFVGDDVTDEDAFRSPSVTLAIRVGPGASTAARYFLPGQADVDELLRAFVGARSRHGGLGRRSPDRGTPKHGGNG